MENQKGSTGWSTAIVVIIFIVIILIILVCVWRNWNSSCLLPAVPTERLLLEQEVETESTGEKTEEGETQVATVNLQQNEPVSYVKLQQKQNMRTSATGSAYNQHINLTPEEKRIAQRRPTKKKLIQKYRKALSMRPITERMVVNNQYDRFNRALDKIHNTSDISNNPRRILRENQNNNANHMQNKLESMMKTMQDANVPINPELANAMYNKK